MPRMIRHVRKTKPGLRWACIMYGMNRSRIWIIVAAAGGLILLGVIVAILTAPRANMAAQYARRGEARAKIRSIQAALIQYYSEKGAYPANAQGLNALCDLQLLDKCPIKDPWGRDYIYKYPGEHGDEPDVISLGADGQPGGEGANADIVSWSN